MTKNLADAVKDLVSDMRFNIHILRNPFMEREIVLKLIDVLDAWGESLSNKPEAHEKFSVDVEASRAIRIAALREAALVAESTASYDDNLQRSAGGITTGQRIAGFIRALMDVEPAP